MATKGQQVIAWAESQLGVHESPWGSNCGGCEPYQAYYPYLGRCGWPWCGAFVGAAWASVVEGAHTVSDPSTATMCSAKPNVSPQVGAAYVICGTHTGLLAENLGGGSWRCISGNESDQVGWSTRNLSGMQVVGPPWLGEGSEEPRQKWFGLQDIGACRQAGARMYYGGWASKSSRDGYMDDLQDDLGVQLRPFNDPDFDGEYLIDASHLVTEVYGLWSSEVARNDARDTLEERLGRTLRPFSESRTKAQGGVPWNAKNLEDPFA